MDKILDNHNCSLMVIRCMDFRFQKSIDRICEMEGGIIATRFLWPAGRKQCSIRQRLY